MQHTDQCQYVVNTIIQFKTFVISRLAQKLLAFQEGHCSTDIKTCLILGLFILGNQAITAITNSNKINSSDERNVN